MINTIILGNALIELPKLPAESVSCVTTSPPYWGLRDYGIEPFIWDGDKDCEHDFGEYDSKLLHKNRQNLNGGTLGNPQYRKNLHGFGSAKAGFCAKCGAWCGSLGLEPTFELYIKHLCDIFDEVKRVLRKDGTCWVNIGDSYGGSGNRSGHTLETSNLNRLTIGYGATEGNQKATRGYKKSLLDIPYRFSIEMTNRGWTKRNTIIWHKPNCMPESADDRFTVDFEYLFFFTKNNKAIFWTNEKTLECVSKKPSGTKGIEGKDWEWRLCPKCHGKGNIKNKICPRCKGLRKVKYSFWTGHDYWFEQQFEEYAPDTLPRTERGVNVNKWTFGADGQTPHNLSQPRLRKERGYKTKQMDKEIHRQQHHGKDINYGKYGRNKRCVWKISTKGFKEAHFATFPVTLIEPIIKAGCPEFICKKCGEARLKIYEKGDLKRSGKGHISYSDCGCNAGWESGIVLDPFMGAGTSALVALKQRKRFIGIEIKQEYIDMAYKRIAKIQQRIF